MEPDDIPSLTGADLRRLAEAQGNTACDACRAMRSPGWEALSATLETGCLRKVGTLRSTREAEPTLEEYHPAGTNAWSADAPIAPGWYPYNRCDVWQCVRCGRAFLRYTEFGGYYLEERIRPVQAGLVTGD
jgi:hypothetical protein